MKKSIDRWLLINYAGLPYAPNSLMPDNGLASLAGALLSINKEVEILDYCTVTTIKHLSNPSLTKKLLKIWRDLNGKKSPLFFIKKLRILIQLVHLENQLKHRQEEYIQKLCLEIGEKIKSKDIQGVGFKLWNGDGFQGSLKIAKYLRNKFQNIKIFAGGPQVDVFMEKIAEYDFFDAVVYSEGEETIKYLANYGNDKTAYPKISNLLYKEGGKVLRTREAIIANLDKLPFPSYDPDIYPAMRNNEKIKIIVLDESRGCKNKCAFCIHPIRSQNSIRVKSIPRLLMEIQKIALVYKEKLNTFRFAGSCTPYSLLSDFANGVLKKNINITYSSFAHIHGIEKFDFNILKRSGCLALFFGIESGSQKIINLMHKGIKVNLIYETLEKAKAAGIFTVGSFIFPSPGENSETRQETLSLLNGLKIDAVTVQSPIVIPRTSWFNEKEKYYIRIPNVKKYLQKLLKWKVKFLLPTTFWGKLPIYLNGEKYSTVLKETAKFVEKIKENGIVTSVNDEMFLMSHRLGVTLENFKNHAQELFFSANVDQIKELVAGINKNIR